MMQYINYKKMNTTWNTIVLLQVSLAFNANPTQFIYIKIFSVILYHITQLIQLLMRQFLAAHTYKTSSIWY